MNAGNIYRLLLLLGGCGHEWLTCGGVGGRMNASGHAIEDKEREGRLA